MNAYFGTSNVPAKQLFVGNNKIWKVYKGNDLVWKLNNVDFYEASNFGGAKINHQEIVSGNNATAPTSPSHPGTGYTFTGWSGSYTNITQHTSLTAQYSYVPMTKNLEVEVYSWADPDSGNIDYSTTLNIGGNTYTTTAQNNTFTLTNYGDGSYVAINSPGVLVFTPNSGETINTTSMPSSAKIDSTHKKYADFNSASTTKTIYFNSANVSKLQIAKLPVDIELAYDGRAHNPLDLYGQSILFGSVKYFIHWYDDNVYELSTNWEERANPSDLKEVLARISEPQPYVFDANDSGFVNIAHRGDNPIHVMHLSSTYIDTKTDEVNIILTSDIRCLKQSPYNTSTHYTALSVNNYATIYLNQTNNTLNGYMYRTVNSSGTTYQSGWLNKFGSNNGTTIEPGLPNGILSIDLTEKSLSDVYQIGYIIKDFNDDCAGIKFKGKYKLDVIF